MLLFPQVEQRRRAKRTKREKRKKRTKKGEGIPLPQRSFRIQGSHQMVGVTQTPMPWMGSLREEVEGQVARVHLLAHWERRGQLLHPVKGGFISSQDVTVHLCLLTWA